MFKICCRCKIDREVLQFSKSSRTKDGLSYRCKICDSELNKEWRTNNQEYDKARQSKYVEVSKIFQANWRNQNREYERKRSKIYKNLNKDKIRKYEFEKYHNDINFRLSVILRRRLRDALKNNSKKVSAVKSLGCSIQEFKSYLESKFQLGMTWENYGYEGWHIDHIIPLANFDLTNKMECEKACHYTNLQPLWAEENFRKNDKCFQ